MRKYTSHITILAAGVAIGVLGGILFGPADRANLGRSFTYHLRKLGKKLQELAIELTQFKHKKMATSLAKVASQDLVNKTVLKAHKLLEQVKALSAQLESYQEIE